MLFAKSEQKETLNSCLLSRVEECPQGGGGGQRGSGPVYLILSETKHSKLKN